MREGPIQVFRIGCGSWVENGWMNPVHCEQNSCQGADAGHNWLTRTGMRNNRPTPPGCILTAQPLGAGRRATSLVEPSPGNNKGTPVPHQGGDGRIPDRWRALPGQEAISNNGQGWGWLLFERPFFSAAVPS